MTTKLPITYTLDWYSVALMVLDDLQKFGITSQDYSFLTWPEVESAFLPMYRVSVKVDIRISDGKHTVTLVFPSESDRISFRLQVGSK